MKVSPRCGWTWSYLSLLRRWTPGASQYVACPEPVRTRSARFCSVETSTAPAGGLEGPLRSSLSHTCAGGSDGAETPVSVGVASGTLLGAADSPTVLESPAVPSSESALPAARAKTTAAATTSARVIIHHCRPPSRAITNRAMHQPRQL